MSSVIVYSTMSCPYCHMAKDYLTAKKVEYVNYDVGADTAKAEEMVQKSGQMGVPVLEINGNIVVGFNRPEIDRLLGL